MAEGERRLLAFSNGPLPSDIRALLDEHPNLRLIESPGNVGLAAGLNAVMCAAGEEGHAHAVLFDQDSEPAPDLPERLRAHWRAVESQGCRPAAIAPRLSTPGGEGFRPISYYRRPGEDPRHRATLAAVEFLPTSGSLVGLDAYRAVGPFRDDFFIDGIDVEWGLRARAMGRPSYLARDLVMPHRWGEPGGGSRQIARQAPLRTYYYARNAAAIARMPHTPVGWRMKTAARLAAQAAYLVWHGRRGRNLEAFTLGVVDGVAGRLGPADHAGRWSGGPA